MSSTSALSLLGRLLFFVPSGRDGQAELLQRQALVTGEEPDPAAAPPRRHGGPPAPRRLLEEMLAARTLGAWLQNRQQTLFPLTLNLRVVDPAARPLLVRMVAASALAGGAVPTAAERERLWAELEAAGAAAAERLAFEAELAAPEPLPPLLRALQEAHLGAHAYAASLLALDRGSATSRAWLDYLTARFGLPPEVVAGLQRRRRWRR
ncbi:DUF533 domain-containing protein [Roseicella aquatilis]|nr:DUF533 domain-containing protein [Roseicella aquatilis]